MRTSLEAVDVLCVNSKETLLLVQKPHEVVPERRPVAPRRVEHSRELEERLGVIAKEIDVEHRLMPISYYMSVTVKNFRAIKI